MLHAKATKLAKKAGRDFPAGVEQLPFISAFNWDLLFP